jgi:hypothetical protein
MGTIMHRALATIMAGGLFAGMAQAGSLDAPAAPTEGSSAMYTLEDLHQRLTKGTLPAKRSGAFSEPSTGPTSGTMHTLNEIMEAGIIPPKTGQTTSYATGDDGDVEAGRAWPVPRFSPLAESGPLADQIRDNLTGLIWARHANFAGQTLTWQAGLDYIASTNSATTLYGGAGDWRLPNVQELFTLVNYSAQNPALPSGHPFSNVQNSQYWTSNTAVGGSVDGRRVSFASGQVDKAIKTSTLYIWPVRGGR